MSKLKLSKRLKIVLLILVIVAVAGIVGGAAVARDYMADNPAACGKCHVMQPFVQSYSSSNFLDNVHATNEQQVKCEACHRQSVLQQAGELFAFIRGNYAISEKNVETQSACKNCHQVDGIVETVRNRPEFIANPQTSYHLNAEMAKACRDPRAEIVRCQDCHKSHRAGVNYCATCHSSTFGTPDK